MRPQDVGAIPIGSVNVLVGTDPTLINPTDTDQYDVIALSVAKGNFNVSAGDRTSSMPTSELPTASDLAGTGALFLREGTVLVLAMPPAGLTIKGYAADSVLNYWFC